MSYPQWLGLLRWSLNHQDGTKPSEYSQMSEENRKWLEQALKEGVRDDVQRMGEIMQDIKDAKKDIEHTETLIDELRDITEQIDMAGVFIKLGGLQFLIALLKTAELSLRPLIASALATLAQNNPAVQIAMVEACIPQQLARMYLGAHEMQTIEVKEGEETEGEGTGAGAAGSATDAASASALTTTSSSSSSSSTLPRMASVPPLSPSWTSLYRLRLLQAISCIVRAHVTGEEALCRDEKEGAVPLLAVGMMDEDNRLRAKAAFVLRALIVSDSATGGRIVTLLQLAGRLVALVKDEDMDARESALFSLIALCQRGATPIIRNTVGPALLACLANREQVIANILSSSSGDELEEEKRRYAPEQAQISYLRGLVNGDIEVEGSVLREEEQEEMTSGAGSTTGEELSSSSAPAAPLMLGDIPPSE